MPFYYNGEIELRSAGSTAVPFERYMHEAGETAGRKEHLRAATAAPTISTPLSDTGRKIIAALGMAEADYFKARAADQSEE